MELLSDLEIDFTTEEEVEAKKINLNPFHETGGGKKKVGRNDPCPCGSGKKYKRCCLRYNQ
jgi:preprotein translocase subunit SecA